MAVDTVALRQVKNQRVVMKAGLYIHTACIPALTYFRLCNIMPPPTDAIWTDSMLCASPCAGNEMHCMQPLSRTIVACVLQLPSPVEAYSELCWQLSLCTRSVCRPSTLRCQRLRLKVEECAVSALQLWWRTPFFISAGVTWTGASH